MDAGQTGLLEAMLHRLEVMKCQSEQQTVLLTQVSTRLNQLFLSLEGLRKDNAANADTKPAVARPRH